MNKGSLGRLLKKHYGVSLRQLLGKNRQGLLEDMVDVPCNLCGSSNAVQIANRDKYGLSIRTVMCEYCGLIYLSPRPSPESYSNFYESGGTDSSAYHLQLDLEKIEILLKQYFGDDYHRKSSFFDEISGSTIDTEQEDQGTYDNYGLNVYDYLQGFIDPGNKIFEVGASCGRLLLPWKEKHNCIVSGIEPKKNSVKEAKQYYNIDLIQGFTNNPEIPSEHYDLVLNLRTLDHMLDPLAEIRRAWNWLKVGGHLFIDVQATSMRARTKGLSKKIEIDHAYIFSLNTLSAMMQKAGFKIINAEYTDLAHVYKPDRKDNGGIWQLRVIGRKVNREITVEYSSAIREAGELILNSQIYEDYLRKKKETVTLKLKDKISLLKGKISQLKRK